LEQREHKGKKDPGPHPGMRTAGEGDASRDVEADQFEENNETMA